MGKAKPGKKITTPVKISTSLFQKRKAKQSSSDSSTDSSSIPSPQQVTKKKASKAPPKAKPKTPLTGGTKSATKPKAVAPKKDNKAGESKKKAGTTTAKEKPKKHEEKGGKGNPEPKTKGKVPAGKTTAKTKKEKVVSPKRKLNVRGRSPSSSSSNSEDSSSSSTTTDETSSSSRTRSPSPPRKAAASGKKTGSPAPKPKAAPAKKVPRKDVPADKKSPKTTKASKEKPATKKGPKLSLTKKGNPIKPKGKQAKPKAKLRRMASLNAKAILEASFSFEGAEKRKSPAGTPIKSGKGGGTSNQEAAGESGGGGTTDFKPLTLLFSSVTGTDFPKESQSPKSGERKRKSTSVAAKGSESPNRRESTTSNGSPQFTPKRRESHTSAGIEPFLAVKSEKERSRSPAPKKKAKVTSSSVSTSTSPFDSGEEAKVSQRHHTSYDQPPHVSGGDVGLQRNFTLSSSAFRHHNLHSDELQNHFQHHHTQGTNKGRGTLAKEKVKSATPTPISPFGSTVYQPAGPLIEPHKSSSATTVPAGLLPDTVRIPSDLKVTYQPRPPPSALSGNQSSKGSEKQKSFEGRQSGGSKPSLTSHRSQSKQILHQPYKSTTTASPSSSSSSMTVTTSTKQPQSTTFIHSPLAVNSTTFSAQGAGSMMMSGAGGPLGGATGTLTQSAALSSHINPSAIMTAGTTASPGSLYFGYGGHQSPFAPSKFPMGPPDFRAQSPFSSPYLYPPPTTPQPSPNYFMAPSFYNSQSLGQPPGGSGLSLGTPQARPLYAAHHHPSSGGGSAVTGAPFYQPPPSAHPVSNYYVAAPPSHHSMQPSTAPGHAGPSLPNPSSQPACPCPSSPRNSNSTSNNNNSITNTTNNNKASRSLLRKLPPQLPVISVTPPEPSAQVGGSKPKKSNPINTQIRSSSPALTPPLTTTTIRSKPIRLVNKKTLKQEQDTTTTTQAKQLENAKTFTEQYSLPDDITITPIIMNTQESKALPFSAYGTPAVAKAEKKKDIVHVIDTRSGESTTIAKHISINNIHRASLTPRNVSSVKPNNAGNVGKISPSLDVIVLNSERKQALGKLKAGPGGTPPGAEKVGTGEKMNHQRPTLLIPPGVTTERPPPFKSQQHSGGKSLLFSNANMNLVQPLYQPVMKNENKNKAIRRKGLTLNECIDGLQRKKMRILADTNVSITNVTPPPPSNNIQMSPAAPINNPHRQLTISTTTDNHNQQIVIKNLDLKGKSNSHSQSQLMNQKSSRKDTKPKQRTVKNLEVDPSKRLNSSAKRTASTESDFSTKLIDCNAAVAAVSALLIPAPMMTMSVSDPNSPPIQPYSLHNTGMKKRQAEKKPTTLKIKLFKSEAGKITTRSSAQTPKLRTRGTKLKIGEAKGGSSNKFVGRGRSRLLMPDKDGSKSDSSGSVTPNFLPYADPSQGNGSSTLTTSNNHVILRIPKASGDKSTVQSRMSYPIGTSGNMTLNAMKKRAIVKPLSPSVINGAIHSLALSNKKLPIHTHPRWSNGWRFEGKPFEAKVYIKNDDNPVLRRCYPTMRHDGGDVIRARDCVLLKSGPRKTDLPFVAKVAALFENPADGEMMFSLLWYYRPEHTDIGRNKEDMPDEIFASKHRDSNSVATIEDKCYVFTFNEYCRYKKRLKQLLEGVPEVTPIVPLSKSHAATRVPVTNFAADIANAVWFGISTTLSNLNAAAAVAASEGMEPVLTPAAPLPPPVPAQSNRPPQTSGKVSPEVVFFCRRVYDYRQKRMLKNPS